MKAVILDLFETLVDFSLEEYDKMLASMARCVTMPEDQFIDKWHAGWPAYECGSFPNPEDFLFSVCGSMSGNDDPDQAMHIHRQFEANALTPRTGAIGTLNSMRQRGYRIGMVTNCPPETAEVWPRSQFVDLIDVPVFSCVEGIRKPDPRLFLICLERLGAEASEGIFIGDGANDELLSAASIGLTAILLNNHNAISKKRLKAWDGLTISSFAEVDAVLTALEMTGAGGDLRDERRLCSAD